MTDKRTQVALQCKAVSHMATTISKIYSDYEKLFPAGIIDDLVDQLGKRTALLMEDLGDMLNATEACPTGDEWIDPVFEEAQRLWPQSK